MSDLEKVISNLSRELTKMVITGYNLNNPVVIKKSQELDKYVTQYYLIKKSYYTL